MCHLKSGTIMTRECRLRRQIPCLAEGGVFGLPVFVHDLGSEDKVKAGGSQKGEI